MSYGYFSKYDREVVRVFQIREHHAKIVKLGRYAIGLIGFNTTDVLHSLIAGETKINLFKF